MAGDRSGSGIAATWGVRRVARTGPKASLSVDRIAQAATDIADRDGLAAVTMEAVARRLGCTKMALYRYLDSKEDLVAVMFDAAMGAPPATATTDPWQERLRHWATTLLARYEAHAWALDVPLGATVMTRNQTLWLEAALAVLRGTALPLRAKLSLVLLVNGHVVFSGRLRRDARAAGQHIPDPELMAVMGQYDLPEVSRVFDRGYLSDEADELADFQWGLSCILAGAEAAATGRKPPMETAPES